MWDNYRTGSRRFLVDSALPKVVLEIALGNETLLNTLIYLKNAGKTHMHLIYSYNPRITTTSEM